jgi:hypothetical protein
MADRSSHAHGPKRCTDLHHPGARDRGIRVRGARGLPCAVPKSGFASLD